MGKSKERLLKYKTFAAALSYPDNEFFRFFPEFLKEKDSLISEYDRLFRAGEVWLYGAEYTAENEFQRAKILSDINGFYRAFGLEPNQDRPDSLVAEFEFMHYLIYKMIRAPKEKVLICLDAQRKFFAEHLYPAAEIITKNIISQTKHDFYREIAQDILEFLASERMVLKQMK